MSEQGSQRILVVDDEPVALMVTARTLAENGYVVATEEGALAALDRLRRETCDLVISGLKMPDYDGLFLLDKVRERHPGVIVIIMTGHGDIETAVNAMRRGASDYVEKPLRAEELLLCVERAFRERRLSKEVTASQEQALPLGLSEEGESGAGVGPNDPCPCGSGRKYKKCCMRR